jgi:hypothetical protein
MLAIVLIATATSCHSKTSGGELELTAATDPGANAFMPPVVSPPPTNTQPQPTLQPQGDATLSRPSRYPATARASTAAPSTIPESTATK